MLHRSSLNPAVKQDMIVFAIDESDFTINNHWLSSFFVSSIMKMTPMNTNYISHKQPIVF